MLMITTITKPVLTYQMGRGNDDKHWRTVSTYLGFSLYFTKIKNEKRGGKGYSFFYYLR